VRDAKSEDWLAQEIRGLQIVYTTNFLFVALECLSTYLLALRGIRDGTTFASSGAVTARLYLLICDQPIRPSGEAFDAFPNVISLTAMQTMHFPAKLRVVVTVGSL
jgi:hypothetical protein